MGRFKEILAIEIKNIKPFLFLISESIPLSYIADDINWPLLHHAQFTGKAHSLIMVYNYDIYYRLGPSTFQSYRVTADAVPGIIYNGIPDWLYEGNYLIYIILRSLIFYLKINV